MKTEYLKKENTFPVAKMSLASVFSSEMAVMLDSFAAVKMMLLSVWTEGSFISADHLSLQSRIQSVWFLLWQRRMSFGKLNLS